MRRILGRHKRSVLRIRKNVGSIQLSACFPEARSLASWRSWKRLVLTLPRSAGWCRQVLERQSLGASQAGGAKGDQHRAMEGRASGIDESCNFFLAENGWEAIREP